MQERKVDHVWFIDATWTDGKRGVPTADATSVINKMSSGVRMCAVDELAGQAKSGRTISVDVVGDVAVA